MRTPKKLVLGLAVLALGLVPVAGAGASGPEYAPEHPPKTHTPKGHAYGYYCKGESKKHVDGEKGTAFSRCVQAMAKADHDEEVTAREACKLLSKKHVKGVKGTPFSTCVKGVAQMRKEKHDEEMAS
ncbi:MAG TPA: hypothetical protein VFI17_12185 [Solirubrobacterales bacterium]|nr:hypothetical protein [Solirubrobacterales bacterium]